ncbi:hypothetical protein C1Y40_04335 [Mycobacterium talmoniae]|uniref:Uncharacterized protein n=1 Tax=Mycobacterium talmoniae TaxID=1858794 RepID=A0A2S8BFQ7_9MYCO|nr:hypothetical protein C1Y40_04335 [Mycobacterium talmoniae]
MRCGVRVLREFTEQCTQRGHLGAGGHQRGLGHRVHHDALADRIPLALVAVQQSGWRPAVHRRGELPAEVDRILQPQVEAGPADRGVHVGGVADQEHVAVAVTVGLAGVLAVDPAQRVRTISAGRFHRQVDAQHPAQALPQFLHRHRRVVADRFVAELDRSDERSAGFQFGDNDTAAVHSVVPERDSTAAGKCDTAVVGAQLGRQVDVGDPQHHRGGESGESDAGGFADQAATPVGADQVSGTQRVGPVGAGDDEIHAAVALGHLGQPVAPPDFRAQAAGPGFQVAHQPWLRDQHPAHRIVRHAVQRQRNPAEGSERGWRRPGRATQLVVEPAHVEHPNHLPDKAVGFGLGAGLGKRVQHDRAHAGQREFAGGHQSVGTGAGDDNLDRVFTHGGDLSRGG